MASVSVEKGAVKGAISLCKSSIVNFNATCKKLLQSYSDAGNDWNDSKYKQLGTIVIDCKIALNNPISELEECCIKLEELLNAIIEYESTNI